MYVKGKFCFQLSNGYADFWIWPVAGGSGKIVDSSNREKSNYPEWVLLVFFNCLS